MHWHKCISGVGLLTLVALTGCGRTGMGLEGVEQDSDGSGASSGSGGKTGSGSGTGGDSGSGATGSGSGATGSGATGSGATGSGATGSGGAGAGGSGVGGSSAAGSGGFGGVGTGGSAVTVGTGVTGVGPGVGVVSTTGGFGAVTSSVTTTSGTGGTGGVPPDFGDIPLPDDCVTEYASLGSDYCDLQLTCSGLYSYTWCWSDGGTWQCECESPNGWDSYVISGLPGEDMCPFAASVCLGATDVDFSDLMCTPTYEERGNQYCSSEAQCSGSAMLPDGVNVSLQEWRYAYCNQAPEGWMCQCDNFGGGGFGGGRGLALTFHDVEDGAALCSNMFEWCSPDGLERIGTPSCVPTYQWADTVSCNADMECSQPATLDGGDVSIREWMPVSCVTAGEGSFNCQCATAGSFSVTSDSPWDACTSALDKCAE